MKFFSGIILISLLGFMSIMASAQSRQQLKTDSVFRLLKIRINDHDMNGIQALMGDKYKRTVADNLRALMEKDLFPYGEIKSDSLISFVNNNQAMYNLEFNAITYHLIIKLDEKNKIGSLFFQEAVNETKKVKDYKVPTSNPMVSTMDKTVDSLARLFIQKLNTVGLSIGIIKDGKTSIYNYGETAKGNKNLPDNNTIFEIGSITKTFTATLLAYYVNEGKISLNDPITKFLPANVAANPALKDIKLINLSNHTSGLPHMPDNLSLQRPYDEANPYKNYTRELLFDFLSRCSVTNNPGEKYGYSNMAVGLLGIILEKVSGRPFEQMVSEIIAQPLGMKSTVQHIYPMIAPRFARVYDDGGRPTSPWDFDALAGAGALRSSISDMLLYTQANLNPKGTKPLDKAINLTHQITLNSEPRMGMGWHIIVVGGIDYYFHNGGTGGSNSLLAFSPAKNFGIVILSNADESTDTWGVDLVTKIGR